MPPICCCQAGGKHNRPGSFCEIAKRTRIIMPALPFFGLQPLIKAAKAFSANHLHHVFPPTFSDCCGYQHRALYHRPPLPPL